ncbi:AF4/FMR2 family member 1-like [Emys orbicularis]|uniref:AF4/FMR2 family member 1-like n=1 Tax=Emys orbicularis TaxID=82168 RepID=UPI0031FBE28A
MAVELRQRLCRMCLRQLARLSFERSGELQTDKVAKAFQYLEAALSFIEYGIAMESDALTPKSAYTIFTDTIDLLKFIMTLKSFSDTSASAHEKIFAVLCMRCQSILHMAMFRYKKDTAVKYSRTLNEHFKNSSRVTQAPSPCVARSTGTPSPLSPMPSPASSVSSQPGSNASNCGSGGIGSSINTLHNIPNITFSYVNITSYILYAYDIWEQADALARKNKVQLALMSQHNLLYLKMLFEVLLYLTLIALSCWIKNWWLKSKDSVRREHYNMQTSALHPNVIDVGYFMRSYFMSNTDWFVNGCSEAKDDSTGSINVANGPGGE